LEVFFCFTVIPISRWDERISVVFNGGLPMIRLPKWALVTLALVFMLGLTAPVLADEAQGTIKSVAAEKNQLILTDSLGKDQTFHAAAKCKVLINDKEGTLSDLKKGDQATVTFDSKNGKMTATEVRVKRI
jgi:Cu/Ag efflux protein CusF